MDGLFQVNLKSVMAKLNSDVGQLNQSWTRRDSRTEAFCTAVDLKGREKERKTAKSEENMNVVAYHAENFVPQFEEQVAA